MLIMGGGGEEGLDLSGNTTNRGTGHVLMPLVNALGDGIADRIPSVLVDTLAKTGLDLGTTAIKAAGRAGKGSLTAK